MARDDVPIVGDILHQLAPQLALAVLKRRIRCSEPADASLLLIDHLKPANATRRLGRLLVDRLEPKQLRRPFWAHPVLALLLMLSVEALAVCLGRVAILSKQLR